MTPMASLLAFALLSMLSIARSQDRAPHGITYENPVAFSPSAFEFFHPNTEQPSSKNPGASSNCSPLANCSPLTLAATVQSTLAHDSISTPNTGGSKMGVGGIVGIVFGFVFSVLLAMGVYYVAITRRSNFSRTNSVQPDV
ncbi:unnamed protein product [Ilex paraguariensis]|uniref:Transmembrane protein n=1 Tax=Ilex paraguariensis TaxID=185542 RepID=A0ABC8REM0_9AQUA